MRHSIVAFAGSIWFTITVACSSEPSSTDTPHTGAGGTSSAGTGSAGKRPTAGRAGAGAAGSHTGSRGTDTGAAGKGAGSGGSDAGRGGSGQAGSGGTGGASGRGGAGTGGTDLGAGGDAAGAGGDAAGAAGDTAGAAGDENLGGAAGGPSCSGEDVLCGSGCIDPQARTQDQMALDMSGSVGLSSTQRPGESFTVGTAGVLTGVEVAVGPCNGADTTGEIQLELFDAAATSLGHVTLAQASLPDVCGGEQILDGTIGAGYFDLTPLCVSAQPGDQYTFILSLVGGTPGTCDTMAHECSNGSTFCFDDSDCGGFYYVGETNCGGYGCEGAPSEYPGGSEVMQDVDTGALSATPAFEMAFKTFMQPTPG